MKNEYIQLTADEQNAARKEAADRRWGFTRDDLVKLLEEFKTADIRRRSYIDYLLEDCNFHTFSEYLLQNDFTGAENWIKATYGKEEEKQQ